MYRKERPFTIKYPTLPDDTDFETFRKTDRCFLSFLKKVYPISRPGVHDEVGLDESNALVKHDRTRYIMQMWPRDPEGESMGRSVLPPGVTGGGEEPYDVPEGKMTSNGLPLWGETLYDFYYVNKFPNAKNMLSIISGSKVARWMRMKGETYAENYLDQDSKEGEPRIMNPYSIGNFIEFIEEEVHLGKTGRSMIANDTDRSKLLDGLLPRSEHIGRWPLVPFSTPTCRLQERIPRDKLPKKLIVHDPWDCLSGKYLLRSDTHKWTKAKDVVYIYHLTRGQKKRGRMEIDDSISPEQTSEAHLYITPKRRMGLGHHSFIYQVELELPRELLVKPNKCTCASKEAPTMNNETTKDRAKIFPDQHATHCASFDDGTPRPRTAKVSVTAKLTMPADSDEDHTAHLRNEAWNYMNFPDHLFEHWNGYNMIHPCTDPLPVGAVVPQFYGYYVPDKAYRSKFMSPILLLEHCGKQADMQTLTLEERRECWSLLKRLHLAGFVHNSVYERNIVMQNGPVQWSPFRRSSLHPRFRLIDFGRTTDAKTKYVHTENRAADKDFKLGLFHQAPYS